MNLRQRIFLTFDAMVYHVFLTVTVEASSVFFRRDNVHTPMRR